MSLKSLLKVMDNQVNDPDIPYMERLVEIARANISGPDVPIAACVTDASGRILSTAINQREAWGDPTAHAEILAIKQAAAAIGGGWRLTGCQLYVTIEPCIMCAGAINLARMDRVVFGAFEPKTGGAGSLWDALRDPRLHYRPAVRSGVMEKETQAIMHEYFARLRD